MEWINFIRMYYFLPSSIGPSSYYHRSFAAQVVGNMGDWLSQFPILSSTGGTSTCIGAFGFRNIERHIVTLDEVLYRPVQGGHFIANV